jgi:Transposase
VEETDEAVELVERVAALDIGKATLTCCIRIPHEANPARRRQEVTEYSTTTRSLLGLADRLRSCGVTLVAMEATSDYWKPAFYLLEAEGFECWLLNAKHVKNVPGRPKTDKLDAVWAGQGGRARHVPAQLRATQTDPPTPGPDPLPAHPDPGADPREAAAGEAPRRRPDQAVGHGL